MRKPLRVTFDTNTYSVVARPQVSKILTSGWPPTSDRISSKTNRFCWWYIQWCIRKGRICAGIPEAAFAAEVLPKTDRVDLLLATGTSAPRPPITPGRWQLIRDALGLGFRVMHGPRIGWPALFAFGQQDWARDEVNTAYERQKRMSAFIRHFEEFPLRTLQNFGQQLSVAHNLALSNSHRQSEAHIQGVTLDRLLWREGLAAESLSPQRHPSSAVFQGVLRKMMSNWVDFDVAATHYAYGYDLLCTEDKGLPISSHIFGPRHNDAAGRFTIRSVTARELARTCWKQFRLPLISWVS